MGSEKPYSKWTVTELREELKDRRLDTQGVKQVLIERLAQDIAEKEEEANDGGHTAEEPPAVYKDEEAEFREGENGDANLEDVEGEDYIAFGSQEDTHQGEEAEHADEDAELADEPMAEAKAEQPPANIQQDVNEEPQPDADPENEKPEPLPVVDDKAGEPADATELKANGRSTEGEKAEPDEAPKDEWELMDIPEEWRPSPLFLVRNIAAKEVTENDVKAAVEVAGLQVRSVTFDERVPEKLTGRKSAIVRLSAPPLPWNPNGDASQPDKEEKGAEDAPSESKDEAKDASNGEGKPNGRPQKKRSRGPQDGDVEKWASYAVQKLRSFTPPVEICGERVNFENAYQQVQLYVGNLSPEWSEDEGFRSAMKAYGNLERAFVMRNPEGLSKGYGFVEFSHPQSALKCKQAMDKIEQDMRPDPKKRGQQQSFPNKPRAADEQKAEKQQEGGDAASKTEPAEEGNGDASKEIASPKDENRMKAMKAAGWSGRERVELVKLLRAEWAVMRSVTVLFSKVLYVANLRTGQHSQKQLQHFFSKYGEVAEVTVPKNKTTNMTKGFAFVAFKQARSADKAYRALQDTKCEELGPALVSFANSAKHQEAPRSTAPTPRRGPEVQHNRGGGGRGFQPGGRGGGPPARQYPGPSPYAAGGSYGRGGRGGFAGGSRPMEPSPIALRQQQLQMQAGQAAQLQMARQMEMRMQQQMVAQKAQLQAQLRQAQLQVQQFQQQSQQLQRTAAQAQAKAAAEAEARRRAEEEARKVAALARPGPAAAGAKRAASQAQYSGYAMPPGAAAGGHSAHAAPASANAGYSQAPGANAYASQYGAAAGTAPGYGAQGAGGAATDYAGQAAYGAQAGYSDGQSAYARQGGYDAQAGYGTAAASSGYSAQGYGQAAGQAAGQGQVGYGGSAAGGYSTQDYGGAAGSQAGYGQHAGYSQDATYGQQAYGQQTGYGADASAYAAAGTGSQAGYASAQTGYDATVSYSQGYNSSYDAQAGYAAQQPAAGQQAGYGAAASTGQKRAGPYSQAGYSGYGGASGYGGSQPGGDYSKRQRY